MDATAQRGGMDAERAADDAEIAALGPWFHNLHLPDGRQTAPAHWLGDFPSFKWRELSAAIPADLTGWTALDIGCNAGFYSFELARRGAQVMGIDRDERYLAQARWAARRFGLAERTAFHRMHVYDLARLPQRFDLVLFMGVFYHLRYPVLGLDAVCEKVDRLLIFQTLTAPGAERYPAPADFGFPQRALMAEAGWPSLAFIEHAFQGDPTNWFAPNRAAVEALLRSAGMRILGTPMDETWVCAPDPDRPSAMRTWNREEYLAAACPDGDAAR